MTFTEFDRAVQQLANHIKSFKRPTWQKLASDIKFDEEDLKAVAHGKKKATPELAQKLIKYSKKNRIEIPTDVLDRTSEELRQNTKNSSFIGELGINETISNISIKKYGGKYLLFSVDDDRNVVVARCVLSQALGSDLTPIYRSWRRTAIGFRRFTGAYFFYDSQLYLVGSRPNSVDLRLSVFHVIPDEEQQILRGMALGVSPRGAILSSRCLLMSAREVRHTVRRKLCAATQPRASLQLLLPEAADFLFGEGEDVYIKLTTGE
jgi:hypothetical protein